jgi:hypothetical protein
LFAFGLSSCEELGLSEDAPELKIGQNFLELEALANQVYNAGDEALRRLGPDTDTIMVGGAVVSRVANVIRMDYGSGVTANDGTTRSGVILVQLNGEIDDWKVEGAEITVDVSDYNIDGDGMDGTITASNLGGTTGTPPAIEVTIDIDNFKRGTDGMALTSDKTLRWISGFETETADDDSYELSGTSSGVDAANTINVDIPVTDKLIYDRSCEHGMLSGLLNIDLSGEGLTYETGYFDFLLDDGCNNIYQAYLEGQDKTIDTKQQFPSFK